MLSGDPEFKNAGEFEPADYVPGNAEAVKDRGIAIDKLAGDEIGLKIGLEVTTDFFGNEIIGMPDLGAVEIR